MLAIAVYVLHYTYRRNGIEEVVGSIPSGSTKLTSCFYYVFSLADSPRHVRELAGRCAKERVSETPKSETSRANSRRSLRARNFIFRRERRARPEETGSTTAETGLIPTSPGGKTPRRRRTNGFIGRAPIFLWGSSLEKEPRRSPHGRQHRFARDFSRRAGALVRPDEQVRARTIGRRRPWEDQQAVRRHGRAAVVRPPLP